MNPRTEASYQRYLQAKKLVEGGMSDKDAIKAAGIGSNTWYKQKERAKKTPMATKPTAKTKRQPLGNHRYVDLHPQATQMGTGSVFVIVCQPNQLKQVLKGINE